MFEVENSRGDFMKRNTQNWFSFTEKPCSKPSRKKISKICCQNQKRFAAPAAGLFFFLFVIFLIILITTDLVDSSEEHKDLRMKRYHHHHYHSNGFSPHNRKPAGKPTNVRVLPVESRRNVSDLSDHNRFKPQLFDKRMGPDRKPDDEPPDPSKDHPNNIEKSGEHEPLFEFRPRNQAVRIKGGFLVGETTAAERSERENARNGGDFRPHEINEMMQKELDEHEKKESPKFEKKTFKNLGSPFRLSSKGSNYHPSHRKRSSNLWVKSNLIRNKKKPLTLLMDIYPMNHHDHVEEDNSMEGTDKKTFYKQNLPENVIYIPIKSKNGLTESMISRLISPKERQNRMLLKLNLYPTGKRYRGKGGLHPDEEEEGEEAYLEIMRPGRRTSPSLSKYKKLKLKFKSRRCCRDPSVGGPLRKLRKIRRVHPVGKLVKGLGRVQPL